VDKSKPASVKRAKKALMLLVMRCEMALIEVFLGGAAVVSILIFIYIQFSQLDSNNKTDQNSC
jgi:hypothetical protein